MQSEIATTVIGVFFMFGCAVFLNVVQLQTHEIVDGQLLSLFSIEFFCLLLATTHNS